MDKFSFFVTCHTALAHGASVARSVFSATEAISWHEEIASFLAMTLAAMIETVMDQRGKDRIHDGQQQRRFKDYLKMRKEQDDHQSDVDQN